MKRLIKLLFPFAPRFVLDEKAFLAAIMPAEVTS